MNDNLPSQLEYKNYNYKLTPFKLCVLENFPFIEADFDAITNYQLLCKVVEYLNNVIDNQNTVEDNFKIMADNLNTLYNYIDNLNLQDEVNNKLDEMVEDGTFNTILNNYSIGKDTFRTRLYMSKIGRLNFTEYLNNGYVSIQGGCYIGNNQYIVALIKNNENGDARILKIDLSLGSIINYNDVTGLYHGNGTCINNNKIYFTQSFDNNNDNLYNVIEVDISSLEITNTYPINFNNYNQNQILGIGYDEVNSKFYLIAKDYFYKTDSTFNVENMITMEKPNSRASLLRQGGTFYNNYICYVANNENAIICLNTDGTIHHIIDIGQQQLNNYFGEIEDINIYNNNLYFHSTLQHVTAENLTLLQFFKANLIGGGLPQVTGNNLSFQNNAKALIYVNKTVYSGMSDYNKFTCDGTTSKPLETIAEALSYIDSKKHYEIVVTDTTDYLEELGIYNKNVTLRCNNSRTGSIKILSSNVILVSTHIEHASYRSSHLGENLNYITPLYITACSKVWITGNSGFNYSNCLTDGMVYPCIIEGSTVYDGSSNSGNYYKFIQSFNNEGTMIYPRLLNADINSSSAQEIINNKVNFSTYKDTSTFYTGNQTFNLTQVPLYSNAIRGFNMALQLSGYGSTEYHKFSNKNTNQFIVRDSTSNKFGFVCEFNNSNNTIVIKPYKFNYTSNSWVADTTLQYYPFYEFDI